MSGEGQKQIWEGERIGLCGSVVFKEIGIIEELSMKRIKGKNVSFTGFGKIFAVIDSDILRSLKFRGILEFLRKENRNGKKARRWQKKEFVCKFEIAISQEDIGNRAKRGEIQNFFGVIINREREFE